MNGGGDDHVSNGACPDAAAGRSRRFELLVDRYQTAVLHMCYLCLCDRSLAEDAAEDVEELLPVEEETGVPFAAAT